MEVLRAPIVWRGNLKIRLTPAKRFVLIVHRATTQTHQTCKRASSAQLVTLNLLRNKRRALNAAPVNSTMLPVRFVAKCVSIRRTLVAKEETAVASIAQLDGRPKTAVPNVPASHVSHFALPSSDDHPTGQSMHLFFLPLPSKYVVLRQSLQTEAPATSLNSPGLHSTHDVCFGED